MTTEVEFRVVVIGGRRYLSKDKVFGALNALHARSPIAWVIQGGGPGAAALAGAWASQTPGVRQLLFITGAGVGVPATETPMQRSVRMFKLGKPTYVVAFPGANGTMHEIELATSAKLPIWYPEGQPNAGRFL